MIRGCICLDIDGTLTANPYQVPPRVVQTLIDLYQKGWVFLFVTGRLYSFAQSVLQDIPFPFFFAVQNGADLLWMPEKKLLAREYLTAAQVPILEEICSNMKEDLLLYSGFEKGDFCYYRPARFSPKMLEHLEIVKTLSHKPWQEREDFFFSPEEQFPLVKALGSEEEVFGLISSLKQHKAFEATCVRDPISKDKNVYLGLITSSQANKGKVLQKMRALLPKGCFFIAAGDDYNDVSMLEEADFSIVMETASEPIKEKADLLARSAEIEGIIEALVTATRERM